MNEQEIIAKYSKYEPFFGSWYLKRLLGAGSFGAVFEIERVELSTVYHAALKIMTLPKSQEDIEAVKSSGLDDYGIKTYFESVLQEMVNEFQLMSQLKGLSTIVSYEDHQIIPHKDEIGWDILIKMELLTPLKDVTKDKPLSEIEVTQLGIDICEALEICNAKNIIHRDIKPDNIFVSDIGKYKLGDFGIARSVENSMGSAKSQVGTSNFMAPEITRAENYTKNVDYYSLGLVLHRLLNCNRPPFFPAPPQAPTFMDTQEAHQKRLQGNPLPDPFEATPELSNIIRKATAFNPAERYQSAEDMKLDLQLHLRNLKNQANPLANEVSTISANSASYEATTTTVREGIETPSGNILVPVDNTPVSSNVSSSSSDSGDETMPIRGNRAPVAETSTVATPEISNASPVTGDETMPIRGNRAPVTETSPVATQEVSNASPALVNEIMSVPDNCTYGSNRSKADVTFI